MSKRGRQLFDTYVANYLNDHQLCLLGDVSHVHNLLARARDQGISLAEITEEVGPLLPAIKAARSQPL